MGNLHSRAHLIMSDDEEPDYNYLHQDQEGDEEELEYDGNVLAIILNRIIEKYIHLNKILLCINPSLTRFYHFQWTHSAEPWFGCAAASLSDIVA